MQHQTPSQAGWEKPWPIIIRMIDPWPISISSNSHPNFGKNKGQTHGILNLKNLYSCERWILFKLKYEQIHQRFRMQVHTAETGLFSHGLEIPNANSCAQILIRNWQLYTDLRSITFVYPSAMRRFDGTGEPLSPQWMNTFLFYTLTQE